MSYAAVEQKLRDLPEDCLDELAAYMDFLQFRRKRASEENGDFSRYFGAVRTLEDGMEMQRRLRDEWN